MGRSGCSDACQRVEGAPLFGLVYLIGAEWDETGFNYDPPRNLSSKVIRPMGSMASSDSYVLRQACFKLA